MKNWAGSLGVARFAIFPDERSRTWSAKSLDGWLGGSQNLRHLDAKWVVNNHSVLANPRTRQIVE